MPILGTLLKKGIKLRETRDQEYSSPFELQKLELKKLMLSASDTLIGKAYRFIEILKAYQQADPKAFYSVFKKNLKVYNYNSMYDEWWNKSQKGMANVAWPGKVKYFALSSGTSESASKHIPITRDMVKAIRKTSVRQILTLSKYDLPDKTFQGGILMLGGSTHLNFHGSYFEGDLSGIQAAQLPFWFQHFYKPGKKIAKTREWDLKLEEITKKAPNWNISIIVGVPAWIQILLERIIAHYKVDTIHDIWPDLAVYVHGGVAFDPYRKSFSKLWGKPVEYIETYLASEGFIAFQSRPEKRSMKLVLNNGIFYEFVPFNERNFDENGEMVEQPETYMIDEVEEGEAYAILLSTCSGAWRYLIGDVIKFVSKDESEIVITGRTKHFLSLCGEHMSVDNMNKAIELASDDLNVTINEFTVAGVPQNNLFAHHWFIGTKDPVDAELLRKKIDDHLKSLNDDYKVERGSALHDPILEVLPLHLFYDWMESKGKVGGQNKFPRVLKKELYSDWLKFLKNN